MAGRGRLGGHEDFSSRLTFFFAAVGAAIGLGNLWRFPYVAGEYGGGAFVLVYLGLVLLVSLPLMMAELAMGRRGHHSPVNTLRTLRAENDAGPLWQGIGWLSVIAPLGALTFYSVVAGWSLDYIYKASLGTFVDIAPAEAQRNFDELLASPLRLLLWYTVFMWATVLVVSRGIKGGIERATSFMMPALAVMLIVLVIYAHVIGDAAAAWRFLFTPDFSRLTGEAVLLALGQALFSISVGTGALLTYGAYLKRGAPIIGPSWHIAIFDTSAALLAGLAIFPIVFASGLDPGEGAGLMFVTLPISLGQIPGGAIVGVVFFVLVFFAAFSSSLAMLEPFVGYLSEQRGWRRPRVALATGGCVWIVGVSAVLSFNRLAHLKPLSFVPLYEDRNIFSILDFTVSNVFLPLNAFLIALFAGWVMHRLTLRGEIGFKDGAGYRLWSFLVRYVSPVGVGCVMAYSFLS